MGQVHDNYFDFFLFPAERDPVLEPLNLVIVYRMLREGISLNPIVGD